MLNVASRQRFGIYGSFCVVCVFLGVTFVGYFWFFLAFCWCVFSLVYWLPLRAKQIVFARRGNYI
jgi:hypothetical protein